MNAAQKVGISALILILASTQLAAQSGSKPPEPSAPGSRVISPALMDVLEAWSDPVANYELLALEKHPEVIEGYLRYIEAQADRPFLDLVAETYPATAEAWREATESEPDDATELLAFLMSSQPGDYDRLQKWLAPRGDFAHFVAAEFPELAAELEDLNLPPAGRGVSLLDFLEAEADPAVLEEGGNLLRSLERGGGCVCWTVFAYPEAPSVQTTEIDEHLDHEWGAFNMLQTHLDYQVKSKGVARQFRFARHSEHTLWIAERTKASNSTGMRVRMHCTQDGVPGGLPCENGDGCTGQLILRAGYASRVYERIFASGIWSRQARQFTGDKVIFEYDPPGVAPSTELFAKAVAVTGNESTSWNPSALASFLSGFGQLVLNIASSSSGAGGVISTDLVDQTVTGIAGVITHSGAGSSISREMLAAWDNSSAAPIVLHPNETHSFNLQALAHLYSRGYGSTSKSWGDIDSSYYLTAVDRQYQCTPTASAPIPRAHWLYASAPFSPFGPSSLQSQIGAFIATELGVTPPNLNQQNGQYP